MTSNCKLAKKKVKFWLLFGRFMCRISAWRPSILTEVIGDFSPAPTGVSKWRVALSKATVVFISVNFSTFYHWLCCLTMNISCEFYVYWIVLHFVSWVKRDQLDVTCFIISLFNAQHVSEVNTSILRSNLHTDTTPPQPNHNVSATHIEPDQYNPWNNSAHKSQALNKEIIKRVTSSWSPFIQVTYPVFVTGLMLFEKIITFYCGRFMETLNISCGTAR